LDDLGGEIWVAKKELIPCKFIFHFNVKNTKEATLNPVAKVNLETEFKNLNKDDSIKIEEPQSFITIKELMKKFEKEWMKNNQPNKTRFDYQSSDMPDFDKDGLPDEIEKLYGTDPHNPDSDGDGYKDGEEIKNGYNPVGPGKLSENKAFSVPSSYALPSS